MRIQFKRLFKGHPDWRGVAFRHGLVPQQQDIHAAIGRPVVAQGPRDFPGGMFAAPWFHPWAYALFKVGNDAVCDAGINVLAVEFALGVSVFRCHWFSLLWKWVAWRACNPALRRERGAK